MSLDFLTDDLLIKNNTNRLTGRLERQKGLKQIEDRKAAAPKLTVEEKIGRASTGRKRKKEDQVQATIAARRADVDAARGAGAHRGGRAAYD